MKKLLSATLVLCLLLCMLALVGCQTDKNPDETTSGEIDSSNAEATEDESGEQPSEDESDDITEENSTAAETESNETTEQTTTEEPEETITEGTYPDGESNPDWPYSPGV